MSIESNDDQVTHSSESAINARNEADTDEDFNDNLGQLSKTFVKRQQSTCGEPECLSCKVISYCATIGCTGFGLTTIKSHPLAGVLFATGGLTGLVTFIGRDLKRYRARPPEW